MSKWIIALLVISILGNVVGLYFAYKYIKVSRKSNHAQWELKQAHQMVSGLTEKLDKLHPYRMVFLHHSVGRGILDQGGLRDSLLAMGIVVKGATYGDEIGQETDIGHWPSKFKNDIDRILTFKAHPDMYYGDNTINDIVMFKSCYPNSHIESDGTEPGEPGSNVRSIANFKASLLSIKETMIGKPEQLFVYITAPPMVPRGSSPDAAARAIKFNRWVLEEYLPGYQKESNLDNLQIFDLFGLLSNDEGFLKTEYRKSPDTEDSHPNELANKQAAASFVELFRPRWDKQQQQESDTN